MKSQVNALLQVTQGLLTDVRAVYPSLEGSLSKDLDRLTLNCRSRGLTVFTLDLPSLESQLLAGLESGRLSLEGPYSTAVSSKIRVPRLFCGLWLRIFDESGCLKPEVDPNALFFLRQLLVLGKRIELVCSDDRIQAKIGEYHGIERKLRQPSFTWKDDNFRLNQSGTVGPHCEGQLSSRDRGHYGRDLHDHGDLFDPVPEESFFGLGHGIARHHAADEDRILPFDLMRVHLGQAVDHVRLDCTGTFSFDPARETKLEASVDQIDDKILLSQIQRVADLIFGTFDIFNPVAYSAIMEADARGTGFRHGPGAVAEQLKNWEKSRFPNWPQKLQNLFPFEACGRTAGDDRVRPINHERAARLICVPKTAKGPRLIAAEPTAHQYCQQLLLRFLFDQSRSHPIVGGMIDFKDQAKSGALVLKASLDRNLATVDLSDASDRLSCWTVERMMRSNPPLLLALHAARTRYVYDGISSHPSFLSLRKFASQGTATTFPVMSLVMLCIALGASLEPLETITTARLREFRNQVRVFGDDIILPKRGYARLVRAMELLELKVNLAKSYVNGHFRESCGTDGFMGHCITPVKPRTLVADSPASCQAVVDTSNNLFNKGLFNAAITAQNLLPVSVLHRLRIVGKNDAGFSGLTSFVGSDERHLRSRWNPRLHRDEVWVWSLSDQTQTLERGGFDALLDFFTRSHNPRNPRVVSEYVNRRKSKTRLLWEPHNTCALFHGD
jgi:hypothetical protein